MIVFYYDMLGWRNVFLLDLFFIFINSVFLIVIVLVVNVVVVLWFLMFLKFCDSICEDKLVGK